MKLAALGMVTLLGLGGCTLVPDELEVANDNALTSYQQAVTQGDSAQGTQARWGGVIVGVENKPQQTLVEIVHFPLNHYGKPSTSATTVGRFKAKIEGFVDPIVFEEGRSVTFVGEIGQPVAGMVGEQPYTYPLLETRNYHMWRDVATYDISPLYFHYNMGWYSPFYHRFQFFDPFWGFPHSRVRVIENHRPRTIMPRRDAPPPKQLQPVKRSSPPENRPRKQRSVRIDDGINTERK